jgi:hypothetical protein
MIKHRISATIPILIFRRLARIGQKDDLTALALMRLEMLV